jgi:hypothetical protein
LWECAEARFLMLWWNHESRFKISLKLLAINKFNHLVSRLSSNSSPNKLFYLAPMLMVNQTKTLTLIYWSFCHLRDYQFIKRSKFVKNSNPLSH